MLNLAEVAFIFAETIRNDDKRGLDQNVLSVKEECKRKINLLNGNNGGHKVRIWKNNGCELGEPLTDSSTKLC